MNENNYNKVLKVALALLLPLAIEQSVIVLGERMAPRAQFYSVSAAGVAAIVIGMKAAAPVLGSGLFFGGIVTIAKNYYQNWGGLDDLTRLITLLLALGSVLWFAMGRGQGRPRGRSNGARGPRRRG